MADHQCKRHDFLCILIIDRLAVFRFSEKGKNEENSPWTIIKKKIDKKNRPYYIQIMTTVAMILKEIENMPEEAAAQVLDFALFIKSKQGSSQVSKSIAIKDAYGIFKGINTHFDREEDDRI